MSFAQTKKRFLQTELTTEGDVVDIFTIYNRLTLAVQKWLACIFSVKSFETDIHSAYNNTDLMRRFYVENKNRLRANGAQTLGFSFPYIFFTDTNAQTMTAPLFTWYLNLKPHPSRAESWRLNFDENTPPIPNAFLIQHLKETRQVDISEILLTFVNSKKEAEKSLLDCSFDVSKALGISCSALLERAREFPTKNNLDIVTQRGDVLWCGSFGFFDHAPCLQNLTAALFDKPTIQFDPATFHEFGFLEKDVTQQRAFRTALRHSFSVVEGAYNAGKKYIITDIIINALSQKQKTLVVCDNLPDLIAMQQHLVNLKIGHLSFMLKDIYADANLLVSTLQQQVKSKITVKNKEDFPVLLKQWRRALRYSDAQHEMLNNPVLGSKKVSDLVGLFSESERKSSKSILNGLRSSDYEFSEEEHARIQKVIEIAQTLYPSIGSLKHTLTTLHPNIFLKNELDSAKKFTAQKLYDFISAFKDFQHNAIAFYSSCSEAITQFYEKKGRIVFDLLRVFKEDYSDLSFQHGINLETTNFLRLSSLHASALFSSKSKAVLEARTQLIKSYNALQSFFETDALFQHVFLKSNEKNDTAKIIANTDVFESELKNWRKNLPNLVQDAMQRLNATTAQNLHDGNLTQKIINLESEFKLLTEKLNAANLFALPFNDNRLTLNKKIQFSGEIIEQLEETERNLRDFEAFYPWQNFWLNLALSENKIIEALIKLKPTHWDKAFDSWFYNQVLLQNFIEPSVDPSNSLAQLAMLDQKLKNSVLDYTQNIWSESVGNVPKILRFENPLAYEKLFGNFENDKTLTNLKAEEVIAITDVFPVFFATSNVATFFSHFDSPVFDRVLIYDANAIDNVIATNILRSATRATLFDEFAHNQGFSANSITALARTLHAPVTKLEYLHETLSLIHPLNEKVFYKNLKTSPLIETLKQSIVWMDVSQKSTSLQIRTTNIAETEAIIDFLQSSPKIPKSSQRIGIICLSKPQRDLITALILQIIQKTENGWERFEHLMRTGLWIGTLEELAGHNFETLIVSNTFTDVDSPNISLYYWRKLLNTFTNQLVWVNSIRLDVLRDEARANENSPSVLYAKMASWLYDTAQNDSIQAAITLSQLNFQFGGNTEKENSIFLNTVISFLEQHFVKKRIKAHCVLDSAYTIALALLPDDDVKPLCVIQIDGILSEARDFYHADWEQKLLYKLTQRQIQMVKVSTFEWWKNEMAAKEKMLLDLENLYQKAEKALYKKSQIILKTE